MCGGGPAGRKGRQYGCAVKKQGPQPKVLRPRNATLMGEIAACESEGGAFTSQPTPRHDKDNLRPLPSARRKRTTTITFSLKSFPADNSFIPQTRSDFGGDARPDTSCLASEALAESEFARRLRLERRRTERSQKQFVLMLVDVSELMRGELGLRGSLLAKILGALADSTRDTDVTGWYENGLKLGTILPDVPEGNFREAISAIFAKVNSALIRELSLGEAEKVRFSFHAFPEAPRGSNSSANSADSRLYPDLRRREASRKSAFRIKRLIDVLGSILLLALLSPLMAAIAALIKLTSEGPVFFRQERLGQDGRPFTFLKFRSMRANNDCAIHRDYVRRFISGVAARQQDSGGASVYKLTNDPRITRFGRFLRRASMDELPQLFNVLLGQMSLVGPRPPIAYEVASYEAWHWRRIREMKPGITGLWQVSGRSKSKFDDMVRLDLRYARGWRLTLDFKILLATPLAVISGRGAY